MSTRVGCYEQLVPEGDELDVEHDDAAEVIVLDARKIGPDWLYTYIITRTAA